MYSRVTQMRNTQKKERRFKMEWPVKKGGSNNRNRMDETMGRDRMKQKGIKQKKTGQKGIKENILVSIWKFF